MAPVENQKTNIESIIPLDAQNLLIDLQKKIESSKNIDTSKKTVFAMLDTLAGDHPEFKQYYEDIKEYIRFEQAKNVKAIRTEVNAQQYQLISSFSSPAKVASFGEEKTGGTYNISMPDRTNQGVDAVGRPTADYGKTITGNSGNESLDMASVDRGRQLFSQIRSGSVDTVKQNSETLVSPSLGSITVPKFENQLYRDMITKNDYVPYVVGILAPSQFDPDRISVHVGSPTSIILYDMEGKPTGTIAQFDVNSTIELLNKPKQFANGYWGVPTKDGRNYVLLVSIDNLRNVMSNEVSNIGNTDPQKVGKETTKEVAGVKEIEQTLKEINPETLDKAVTLSEQFINLVPDAQTKATLQGIHGAMILNMLRQAGHNLMIQNGKVTIEPKPGVSVVELQTKLQTLVNTGRLSIDTFKIGLLYSSPIFKKYATELGVTKDAQGNIVGIDPKANSKTFLEHVAELKKTGQNSPDITSLLASASMLESVDFKQAMKGFQDLGQIEGFDKQNPGLLAAVASGTNVSTSTPNAPLAGGAANSTTWTGKLVGGLNSYGVNGAPVSNFVSDSFKGFGRGFNDLVSLGKGDPIATLAIGGALIYGIWRMFNVGGKFGFFKGLGMIFGLGVLNNLGKISGDDVDNAHKKAKEVLNNMTGGTNESDKGWMDSILKSASVDLKEHFTQVIPPDSLENQKEIDRANKLLEKKGQQKRFWSYREHIAALGGPMLDCKIHNLFFSSKQGELLRSSEATLPSNLLLSDNMRKGTMKQLLRQLILGDPASPQDRKYMNDSSIDQATIDTWLKSKNLDQTKMQDMTLRQLVHHITASI